MAPDGRPADVPADIEADRAFFAAYFPGYPLKHKRQELPEVIAAGVVPPRLRNVRRQLKSAGESGSAIGVSPSFDMTIGALIGEFTGCAAPTAGRPPATGRPRGRPRTVRASQAGQTAQAKKVTPPRSAPARIRETLVGNG